jgi:hypothetical protein
MHPAFNLVKRLCEVPYGEALTETPTLFVTLPVALTSGVLVVVGFVCGCVGRQLVCGDIFKDGQAVSLRVTASRW